MFQVEGSMFTSMEMGELFKELKQLRSTHRGRGGRVVVDSAGQMGLD